MSARSRRDFDPNNMKVNTGTKILKLFMPPVPEPARIPLQDVNYNRDWRRYHNATLKIHIFQGQPRPGSLTPSDLSDDNEEVLPEVSRCLMSHGCRCGKDVVLDGWVMVCGC